MQTVRHDPVPIRLCRAERVASQRLYHLTHVCAERLRHSGLHGCQCGESWETEA